MPVLNLATMQPTGVTSPSLSDLDAVLVGLLAQGRTYKELSSHLKRFILDYFKSLPPTKVLYTSSYGGGLGFYPHMERHMAETASVPKIDARERLDAIVEYGRQVNIRLPYIGDVFRVRRTWGLDKAMAEWPQKEIDEWKKGHDADLVATAEAFIKDYAAFKRAISKPLPGNFEEVVFEEFAKDSSNAWMYHPNVGTASKSLAFAQSLLTNDRDKYHVSPDATKDTHVYEAIGLACAGDCVRVASVPAGLHYWVDDYDGQETIRY
jgi:hypothetical protein